MANNKHPRDYPREAYSSDEEYGSRWTRSTDLNPTTGVAALSHTWPVDGQDHNYQIDFGVRCKQHTSVVEWTSITVSIPGETITNHTLTGPTDGLVGIDYGFTATGTSPDGHSLEYKFHL